MTAVIVPHDQGCKYARPADGGHSDPAKRVSDWYNLHRIAQGLDGVGCWVAFTLQDGTSDGVLYDSKEAAAAHQRGYSHYYAYVQIGPAHMSVCEAESVLYMQRMLYRLSNYQDGPRQVIPRLTREDHASMLAAMFRGGRPSNLLHGPRR